jgi:hypothetical protein
MQSRKHHFLSLHGAAHGYVASVCESLCSTYLDSHTVPNHVSPIKLKYTSHIKLRSRKLPEFVRLLRLHHSLTRSVCSLLARRGDYTPHTKPTKMRTSAPTTMTETSVMTAGTHTLSIQGAQSHVMTYLQMRTNNVTLPGPSITSSLGRPSGFNKDIIAAQLSYKLPAGPTHRASSRCLCDMTKPMTC